MAPPPIKSVDSSSPNFPEGVMVIDEAFVEEMEREFETEILPQFKNFNFDSNRMIRMAAFLLGDSQSYSCVNFHETNIPVGPFDLSIDEEARVCSWQETDDGIFSFTRPLVMEGFSTFGGWIEPDRIQKTADDGVAVGMSCLSYDVTDQILKSPVGSLFPDGKIGPVSLLDLDTLKFRTEGPAGEGVFSKIKDAAHLLSVRACPNGVFNPASTDLFDFCLDTEAAVALYVDFQEFLSLLNSEGFKNFIFDGIEVGSFVDWPQFDLAALASYFSVPSGLQISKGLTDLRVWRPDDDTLKIALNNLDAEIIIGGKQVRLHGNVEVTLGEGGKLGVHFGGLTIELPSFPSQQEDLASFSGKIEGDVQLHLGPSGRPVIEEAHLTVDDLDLATKAGRGIRFGKGDFALGFSLQGIEGRGVKIDYVPSDPIQPLRTEWALTGSALVESGKKTFDLTNIRFEGKGGWQEINGRLLPKNLSLQASTEVKVGDFQFVPSLHLDLTSVEKGDGFQVDGDGAWTVTASSPQLSLGSDLHLSTTDLRNFDFSADFTKDQILGSIAASGKMTVVGKLSRDDKKSLLKSFRIKTTKPYAVTSGDKTVLKNVQVEGKGANHHSVITVRTPVVTVDLWNLPWTDRLNGAYRIRRRKIGVNAEFALNNVYVRGRFISHPFGEFFEKKSVFLSGAASAGIGGKLEGPIAADYQATLRWAPEKSAVLLSFNSKKPSTVSVGPILVKDENSVIEANANLQGTLIARYGGGGIAIGGDDIGINEGKVFVGRDGPIMVDGQGQKIPAVYDLSFVADQLNGVRNGVAYCGGRRCRLEAVVDLVPVKVAFDPKRSKLPIFKTPHRIQFSPAAWWRGLKHYIEDGQ